jgi:hypothetical protein
MKAWVDAIKKNGNDSTHKLDPPKHDRAESTLFFTSQLLRTVYETQHYMQKHGHVAAPEGTP